MADKPVDEVVQVDAVLDALSSPTSSDVYEALLPYSNDAVAAVAAKRAAGGAGGGSQPIEVVRVPIAFDDVGIVVTMLEITAVTDGPGSTVTVAGDHAAAFPAGSACRIFNSNAIDDGYTVVSAVFGAGSTVISITEELGDDSVSGSVYDNTSGVVIYTPVADDVLFGGWLSLPGETEWDGSTPRLHFQVEGDDPGGGAEVNFDCNDTNVQNNVTASVVKSSVLSSSRQVLAQGTKPFRLFVDDNSYGDPGSLQGAGEIVLLIAKAS